MKCSALDEKFYNCIRNSLYYLVAIRHFSSSKIFSITNNTDLNFFFNLDQYPSKIF